LARRHTAYYADTAFSSNLTELEELRGGDSNFGEAVLFGLLPPDEISRLRSSRVVDDFITRAGLDSIDVHQGALGLFDIAALISYLMRRESANAAASCTRTSLSVCLAK